MEIKLRKYSSFINLKYVTKNMQQKVNRWNKFIYIVAIIEEQLIILQAKLFRLLLKTLILYMQKYVLP